MEDSEREGERARDDVCIVGEEKALPSRLGRREAEGNEDDAMGVRN